MLLGHKTTNKHNEKADLAAKAALNLPRANLGIPYTDLKFQIDKYIMPNWQDEWNNVGRKQSSLCAYCI